MTINSLRRGTYAKAIAILALAPPVCLATAMFVAAPAFSQTVDTSSPLVVKQRQIKPIWLKAEVIHGDSRTLMVREVDHPMSVHTFTYGPKAQGQMNNALAAGGFHRGDAIKVSYQPGQTVALAIKGKPSSQ